MESAGLYTTGHNTKCGMSKMWGELHETAYTSVIDEC